MKRALTTLTIVSIVMMPGLAHSAKKQKTPATSGPLGYAYEPARDNNNAARSEAIQVCNKEADKWNNRDWQTTQLTVYRDCMVKHGQPFE
jgi:hypothetical protein